jgi:hypothetical protein
MFKGLQDETEFYLINIRIQEYCISDLLHVQQHHCQAIVMKYCICLLITIIILKNQRCIETLNYVISSHIYIWDNVNIIILRIRGFNYTYFTYRKCPGYVRM